jgi:large subunit ribosomal protein L28
MDEYRYTRKPGRTTGYQVTQHRSNRAKEGLYHGKDIRFGNNVSFSIKKTRRTWMPNVQNKRVWSFALDGWIRFKMTTTALKAIDVAGGIDNYLLGLDEAQVQDSNYVTKQRNLVASALFHQGLLRESAIKRLGYHKNPPLPPVVEGASSDEDDVHLQ